MRQGGRLEGEAEEKGEEEEAEGEGEEQEKRRRGDEKGRTYR